jgi:hypothetical protein
MLRNQVAWNQLTSPNLLLHVRSVALASVSTVTTLAVPSLPSEPTARGKWLRLLASDKLKRLHIGNPCHVANEKVRVS